MRATDMKRLTEYGLAITVALADVSTNWESARLYCITVVMPVDRLKYVATIVYELQIELHFITWLIVKFTSGLDSFWCVF